VILANEMDEWISDKMILISVAFAASKK